MLVAALALPPLVDWSNFRTSFERQATRLLGQPVEVAGTTSARLLPWPKVEFETVRIGSSSDGTPLLSLDRLALDVEIAPLLKGDVRVVEMQLDRPRGTLRIGPGGAVDWLGGGGASTLPASDVSIERLTVLEGDLTVVDTVRNSRIDISGIDAELTADTLAGPWRGEGAFTYGSERYRASGTTGALKRDGAAARIATRLSLEPASFPYTLTATGPVAIEGSDASFEGAFSVVPRDVPDGEVQPAPVAVDGAITLDRKRLRLPAFIVRVGSGDDPYRIEGTGEAFFEGESRYALRLQGAQVDAGSLAADDVKATGIAARVAAVGDILRRVPLPAVAGDVTIELPAVVAGDTVIRELSADVRPLADRSGWDVRRFVATLPGRTLVEASGRLAVPGTEGSGLGFEGRMLLASRQPSGFASWLADDVDDAIRQLGSAGFEADVSLGGESARFDDLELRLGPDRLSGTLARIAGRGGERPRILANLKGTLLDAETAAAVFRLFSGSGSDGDLLTHDLDLRVEVDEARDARLSAREIDLVALYENGDLTLDRLSIGEIEGTALDLRGRVEALYSRPRGRLNGTVTVQNPAALTEGLRKRGLLPSALAQFAREPDLLAGTRFDVAVNAQRSGLESEIAATLDGTLGSTETQMAARYSGELGTANPSVEFSLTARNDGPITLLRQLGLKPAPLGLAGPATLSARLSGTRSALGVSLSLDSPDGGIATEGATRFEQGRGDLYEGTFELAGKDIDPVLLALGAAFPGVGTGTPIDLSGRLTADAERIGLDDLAGTVRNVSVDASVVLDLAVEPRPRLDGTLSVGSLDLTGLIRLVLGQSFDLATSMEGGNELGRPALDGFDGEIALTAGTAELGLGLIDAAPARNFVAELGLNDGDVELAELSADWLGGRLSGKANVAKSGENGVIGAELELVGANVAETGFVNAKQPRLSGTFDAVLAVEAQARTDAGLVRALSGGATVTLRDGRLRGFTPRGFADLLSSADETEDSRLERLAPVLATQLLLDGSADLGTVFVPFTIANGVARATGLAVRIDGVDAVADLRMDLPEGTVEGNLRGTLRQPDAEIAVSGIAPDFRIDFSASEERQSAALDATTLTTYLATRLRERREREFEAQRAAILERRRLVQAMRLSRERERRGLQRLRDRSSTAPDPELGGAEELPG